MAQTYRSDCPIARALDVVGDKWTLLLIRDMSRGLQTYQAFLNSAEGIPTNILAARLKRMVEAGLVEKRLYQKRPKRFSYHLSDAGRGLLAAVAELEAWGIQELGGIAAEPEASPAPSPAQNRNEWAFGPQDSVW